MLDITTTASSSDHLIHINDVTTTNTTAVAKRKRRPAGTPDPEAEVVSLSPKTLLESDRYVCEICGQGFQRDQNLQMHRRRHKVPWKLVKREAGGAGSEAAAAKKRVFVCPEKSCLHHDPSHALGDLVGIKKHFRRKHSSVKQWACSRCSKAYAVQSDFKAHLKTCGTRGHSCDCGRVFSRVESFIEHQDSCTVRSIVRPEIDQPENAKPFSASSSRTASSTSPNSNNRSPVLVVQPPALELQLLPPPPLSSSSSAINNSDKNNPRDENLFSSTRLKLSIGPSSSSSSNNDRLLENYHQKNLAMIMSEKAYAEEARREAKRLVAIAEAEFGNAKRIRRQARGELEKAQLLREQATKRMSSTVLQITCQACKQVQFQESLGGGGDETTSSLAMSYVSSATTDCDNHNYI